MGDEEMMKEISAYVAANKRAKQAAQRKKIKDPDSPYLKNLVNQLPAEYHLDNDTAQTRERMRKRIEKEALKKRRPTDPDELLNYYAAQPPIEIGVAKEVVETKALTLPFGDSMMKINQFVQLDRTIRSNDLSFDKYNAKYMSNKPIPRAIPRIPTANTMSTSQSEKLFSTIPAPAPAPAEKPKDTKFHRKYPRLCSSFHFTDADIAATDAASRSDYWMARFLEDCFDEAYIVCNTPVSKETKWRLRNGLDLGSMDCFPKVVERVLNTRYSVLEIRTQVCLEFLCGLERLIHCSETSRIAELPPSALAVQGTGEHVYDGERAQMFSKFLSEEYDLDFLAMFLHVREVVQTVFQFRLRDLNQARIWLDYEKQEDLLEKDIGMAEFTYYRVQQREKTSALAASTLAGTSTTTPGGKRKIAWSAETMTLTAKLDAQIGARKRNRGRAAAEAEDGAQARSMSLSPQKRSKTAGSASEDLQLMSPASKRARSTTAGTSGIATMDTTAGASGTAADTLHRPPEGKKIVPVSLPNSWHFLHDLTMPEAPIVGFDLGLISLLFMHLLPKTSQSVRTYLTDKVVTTTKEALMDTPAAIRDLASDSSIIDSTGRVSIAAARNSYAAGKVIRIIPLYIMLKTLCTEWKKLSLETKVSFIESGAGSASLKSLNVLCADNNELKRSIDRDIQENQKALGAVNATVLTLEKVVRRLERRRVAGTATPQELDTIEESRIQLHSETTRRYDFLFYADLLRVITFLVTVKRAYVCNIPC
jgi:hypothetical protein